MPHAPHVHRWYCTAGWQRRRAHQLMIEPLCRLCLEAGRVTLATVADHCQPHRGDFTAFRLGQLRSLCADCHNRLDRTNSARAGPRGWYAERSAPSVERALVGGDHPHQPQTAEKLSPGRPGRGSND